QRAKINKETGVTMMTVFIADPGGSLNKTMPYAKPQDIEAEALRQAKERMAEGKARDQAKVAIQNQLREVETQHELNAEMVAKLRADPANQSIFDPDKNKKK